MKFTASEIAEQVGGEVVGDGGIELAGFAQADAAKPGDLTYGLGEHRWGSALRALRHQRLDLCLVQADS